MKPYVIVTGEEMDYMGRKLEGAVFLDWRLRGKPPEGGWPVLRASTYEADVVVLGSDFSAATTPVQKMTLKYRVTPHGTQQICQACFEYMSPHLCLICRKAHCSSCRVLFDCETCREV